MKSLRKNAHGIAAILLTRTTREKHSSRLKDLTPAKFACNYMAACPAVLRDRTDGSYLIIGQACDADPVNLSQRIGTGEALIKISGELLEGALAKSVWKKRVKYGMAMVGGASLPYLPQLWTLLHSQFAFLN